MRRRRWVPEWKEIYLTHAPPFRAESRRVARPAVAHDLQQLDQLAVPHPAADDRGHEGQIRGGGLRPDDGARGMARVSADSLPAQAAGGDQHAPKRHHDRDLRSLRADVVERGAFGALSSLSDDVACESRPKRCGAARPA